MILGWLSIDSSWVFLSVTFKYNITNYKKDLLFKLLQIIRGSIISHFSHRSITSRRSLLHIYSRQNHRILFLILVFFLLLACTSIHDLSKEKDTLYCIQKVRHLKTVKRGVSPNCSFQGIFDDVLSVELHKLLYFLGGLYGSDYTLVVTTTSFMKVCLNI